ncbi:MAG: YdcF family protein [Anaerolineales bacterium]
MGSFLSSLAEVVKQYFLPGSLMLLLLVTTAALAWWYLQERNRNKVRAALTAVVLSYWLLATPAVSGWIQSALEGGYSPLNERLQADAVVVLGGGAESYQYDDRRLSTLSDASAFRALEAARLYQLLDPEWVVASGGPGHDPKAPESEALAAALASLDVPAQRIIIESRSSDTHEQAVLLKPMLSSRGIESFVLVTSPTHMRRAMLAFEAAGMDPIASVAPNRSEASAGQRQTPSLVPNMGSLQRSIVAGREVLGLIYYWFRGWI